MLRVKNDEIPLLRRALNLAGMYGDPGIIEKTKMSAQTVARIMDGTAVRPQFMFRLLRALLALPPGDLSEEEKTVLENALEKYCEEPPAAAPRAPRVVRAAPVSSGGNALASIVYYSKCLHLRHKRNEQEGYAYQKLVPGKGLENVFTEFLAVRSYTFHHTQPGMDFEGNCTGIVTLLPTFPPHADNNDNRIDTANFMQHIKYLEDEPGRFYQSAITYINGFLLENETAGVRLVQHCDRASLIVDFSSLPAGLVAGLFRSEPVALYLRSDEQAPETLKLNCQKTAAGVFIVDSKRHGLASNEVAAWNPDGKIIEAWNPDKHALRRGGKVQLHFPMNWKAVSQAYPLA